MTADNCIEIRGLGKRYPGQDLACPALDGISFSVASGELFGLLGPNGAGKSTAIALLAGLIAPDSGTIKIQGQAVSPRSLAAKKLIGYVPQDLALFADLTGRENLSFFAALYGLKGERKRERVDFCLDFAGLTERGWERVASYSGGMKRRLNLSVALLHEPQILLLDEPVVGIDAQSRQLIHSRLRQLAKGGMTMVYTTHYLEEAEELCDRLAIIDRGQIIKSGAPAELLSEDKCASLRELFFHLTGQELRD
ncbi:MAG: ABC transporter ATP-binding protein [Thermodesulfobacteriota bacterium]